MGLPMVGFLLDLLGHSAIKSTSFDFIPGQDITIAARSTLNEPNVLWGMEDGLIYDFTFDNVVIAGEKIDSLDQFHHNEFVLPLIIP